MKTKTAASRTHSGAVANTTPRTPDSAAPPPASYRVILLSDRLRGPFELNETDQVAFTELSDTGQLRAKLFDGSRVLDLGTLGGANAEADTVSNVAQVSGRSSFDESGLFHAYRWSRETGMVDLGTLPEATESQAHDINNMGEVVGLATFGSSDVPPRGVLWRPGAGPLDLGLERGVFPGIGGLKINNAGEVMGNTVDRSGRTQAFSWRRTGGAVLLRRPQIIDSEARDLNAAGQITGVFSPDDGSGFAGYVWAPRRSFVEIRDELRPIPYALNDRAMVVGLLFINQSAFVWTAAGGVEAIGTPGEFSEALEVNNFDQVVGHSAGKAFLWTREEGRIDLNTRLRNPAPGVLGRAHQINDRGSILASTHEGAMVLLAP